jgi:hypothetical protein
MGVSWEILAPLIALLVTVASMRLAIFGTGWVRRHDYLLFENSSKKEIAQKFPLPKIEPSAAELRRKLLSPLVDKVHQDAREAQTTYYNAVVSSAGCLVLAFLALALATSRPEDLPQSWSTWPSLKVLSQIWPQVEWFLNWVDVIAIGFVLLIFHRGHRASGAWLAVRARTEFLRQYQFLDLVFPDAISPPPGDNLKEQFDREDGRVIADVQHGPFTEIVARTERFWSTRRASIANRTFTDVDLTSDALLVYIERRVRRQLGWFTDSQARLEYIAERRKCFLLWLYRFTAILAIIKLSFDLPFSFFEHSSNLHRLVLPPLLFVTGLSAAMTAYYINQNSRSLIHRYYTQRRFIAAWLMSFNERWNFASMPLLPIDASAKRDIRARILHFEDLMIEELIDWTHITNYDAIELAP